jgi:hypothetical protein
MLKEEAGLASVGVGVVEKKITLPTIEPGPSSP